MTTGWGRFGDQNGMKVDPSQCLDTMTTACYLEVHQGYAPCRARQEFFVRPESLGRPTRACRLRNYDPNSSNTLLRKSSARMIAIPA